MKIATSTDIKNHFGEYLETSITEPIVIQKTGRPLAVMISISDYKRLTALEDKYWAEQAEQAEKKGYIDHKESLQFLKSK